LPPLRLAVGVPLTHREVVALAIRSLLALKAAVLRVAQQLVALDVVGLARVLTRTALSTGQLMVEVAAALDEDSDFSEADAAVVGPLMPRPR
jgi:hypothetical protein